MRKIACNPNFRRLAEYTGHCGQCLLNFVGTISYQIKSNRLFPYNPTAQHIFHNVIEFNRFYRHRSVEDDTGGVLKGLDGAVAGL